MVTGSSSFQRLGWVLVAFVIVLDQVTKWLILDLFAYGRGGIEVLSYFNLVLAWNRGISFGLFGGLGDWGPWILIGLAAVISCVLVVWLKKAESRLPAASLGLIIGGAIGNIVDRVRFGAVVDFLDVHFLGYHWPAFNVADSAITVGAVILILDSLFYSEEKPKTEL